MAARASTVRVLSPTSVGTTPGLRTPNGDYFTLRRRLSRATTASPAPSALPSSFGTASLNSASSRGSWSSLFNAGAGSMRQLLASTETAPITTEDGIPISKEKDGGIPIRNHAHHALPDTPRKSGLGGGTGSYTSPRRAGLGAESPRPASSPARGARGWGSPASSHTHTTGNRRLSVTFVPSRPVAAPTFSQVLAAKRGPSMRLAVVDLREELRREE